MEVHHPHHPTHKKQWKEYLIEFIMLFAAVSLGFLAENVREQYIEKERAHEFIARFEVDVKNNIHFLDSLLIYNHNAEYQMDSAIITLLNAENEFDLNFFYTYVQISFPRFLSKNDTYEQMKSSGSLRYIKDEKLLSMMIDYTNETEGTEYRSKEQEANYVLGEYSTIMTKWSPPALSVKRYLSLYENHKSRVQSPDSTTQLLEKIKFMKNEKPYIIKGKVLEEFRNEIIPVITRRMGLMKTSMNYFQRSKSKGELLIKYLHDNH